jgi:hypothetical protein
MARKFLISPQELKDDTAIFGNVDEKLLRQPIFACQDIAVQGLLGTALFDELISQAPSSLTALNTTLLNDYIQPAMRYWILAEIVRPMSFRYQNVGVQIKSTENTQPISNAQITELENTNRNKYEWYAQRVSDYLCENEADYPLYNNAGNGVDTIHPTRNNYTTSINLSIRKRQRRF